MSNRDEHSEYTRPNAPSVYLVWERRIAHNSPEGAVTALRAICKEHALAREYRRILAVDEGCIKAWIEPRALDHLYGQAGVGVALLYHSPENRP